MLKKTMTILLLTFLFGCAITTQKEFNQEEFNENVNNIEIINENEAEEVINPWNEFNDLKEAIKLFGKEVDIPNEILGYKSILYRVVEKEFLDVYYGVENEDINCALRVSYNKSDEDISGVYDNFNFIERDEEKLIDYIGHNENEIILMNWEDNKHNYSLYLKNPINIETAYKIIN